MNADAEILDAVREVKKLSAETRLRLLVKVKRSKIPRDFKSLMADIFAYPAAAERVLVKMIAEA
jgi:hypothetical protein